MRSIWGSSASDVYVVGHNDRGYGKMFHYDGSKWNAIDPLPVGFIDLTAVYGFSSNDVWTAGLRSIDSPELGYTVDSSLIIHYDGTSWKEMNLPGRGRMLQSVGGASPNDVWIGGTNVLYRYDGFSVKHYPIYIPPQGIQFLFIAALSPSEVYMTGFRNDVVQPIDSNFYYLYRFNGSSWNIIDSAVQTVGSSQLKFGYQPVVIDHKLYFGGEGVWEWTGSGWIKLFDDAWNYRVGGDRPDNLFACGGLNRLYHYNGSDWKRISLPLSEDIGFYGIWTDGREAYVVGNDGNRTFIAHGK
jgi:hypothetical protein